MVFLEEGDLAVLSRTRVDLYDRQAAECTGPRRRIDWTPMLAEKGGHKHFMHKGDLRAARALADTLRGRLLLSEGDVFFQGWTFRRRGGAAAAHHLLACGTVWHAGLAGRAMIESLARHPGGGRAGLGVPLPRSAGRPRASWRSPSASRGDLDTLCALREARVARRADAHPLQRGGQRADPRSGAHHPDPRRSGDRMASTKAFTTQLAALYLLAVKLGLAERDARRGRAQELLTQLTEVPQAGWRRRLQLRAAVQRIARRSRARRASCSSAAAPMHPRGAGGRAEAEGDQLHPRRGYAGGEMKHGPIALIDEKLPVVVIAPASRSTPYEKMLATSRGASPGRQGHRHRRRGGHRGR